MVIPQSSEEATDYALSLGYESDCYQWYCPDADGCSYLPKVLEMHIPTEDFRSSMGRDVLRHGNLLSPVPILLIDSNDQYVRYVAEHILSETEGYSDYLRALAVVSFVQCAISYSYDTVLYGAEDFCASPLETLYLHSGDCEDTSVLLFSILKAMGYQSVLLDYDGHVAVGLVMDGRILYCETTLDFPCQPSPSLKWNRQEPRIWNCDSYPSVLAGINGGIAAYRNLINKVTGT